MCPSMQLGGTYLRSTTLSQFKCLSGLGVRKVVFALQDMCC